MFSALIVFDFTNLKVKDYSFKTCWMLLIDVYSRLTQIIYFWKWTYSILIRKEFGASAAICGPFHNVPQGPQYAIFLINILITQFNIFLRVLFLMLVIDIKKAPLWI